VQRAWLNWICSVHLLHSILANRCLCSRLPGSHMFYWYFTFFNDFCQPLNVGFHWTDFHAVFTIRFCYGCRRPIGTSIFDFSRNIAIATNYRFLKFRFFRRNSKTMRGRHIVQGKENVGNFVFCLVAPPRMTSGDPKSQNCFRFVYYSFESDLLKKYATDFRRFFSAGRPTGVDDCYEIGLLSLKGRCHGNKFSSFSDIFRRSGRYFCYAQSPFVRFVA